MALTVGRPVGRKSAAPSATAGRAARICRRPQQHIPPPSDGGRRCAFPPYGAVQQSTPYEPKGLTQMKQGDARRCTPMGPCGSPVVRHAFGLWPGFLALARDDGEGDCRAPWSLGARQGPSQHPRECEQSGLGAAWRNQAAGGTAGRSLCGPWRIASDPRAKQPRAMSASSGALTVFSTAGGASSTRGSTKSSPTTMFLSYTQAAHGCAPDRTPAFAGAGARTNCKCRRVLIDLFQQPGPRRIEHGERAADHLPRPIIPPLAICVHRRASPCFICGKILGSYGVDCWTAP